MSFRRLARQESDASKPSATTTGIGLIMVAAGITGLFWLVRCRRPGQRPKQVRDQSPASSAPPETSARQGAATPTGPEPTAEPIEAHKPEIPTAQVAEEPSAPKTNGGDDVPSPDTNDAPAEPREESELGAAPVTVLLPETAEVSEPEEPQELEEPPGPREPERPKPAEWQVLEPTDPTDAVPHLLPQVMPGAGGWTMAGASRRGKMHAHNGTYREDAFALDTTGIWNLVAVSDGAGSCSLSRVGSQVAAEAGVAKMKELLQTEPNPARYKLQNALDQSLQAAHVAVHAEASRRDLPVKELSATFLLMAHAVVDDVHVVASIQVGDGLIAVQHADGSIEPQAEGDSGAFGGETYFLTSRPAERWLGRGRIDILKQPPRLLAAMSDGVADDFVPYDRHLPMLFDRLNKIATRQEGFADGDEAEVLLQLIAYDKRASFDDRTLVIIFPRPV